MWNCRLEGRIKIMIHYDMWSFKIQTVRSKQRSETGSISWRSGEQIILMLAASWNISDVTKQKLHNMWILLIFIQEAGTVQKTPFFPE